MVIRFLTVCLLGFLYSVSTAVASSHCPSWERVVSEYAVVEVRHYRGGQTTRDDAMGRIGEKVTLSEREFLIWEKMVYRFPSYEVVCYPVPQEEGEVVVPWERRSNFYGFGIDRNVINVLYVTSLKEEGPRYQFEVVEDELWYFLDGWFYRMERVVHH